MIQLPQSVLATRCASLSVAYRSRTKRPHPCSYTSVKLPTEALTADPATVARWRKRPPLGAVAEQERQPLWWLAVGASPLRILFAALVERIAPADALSDLCLPSHTFLHHGVCKQVGPQEVWPCVVEVRSASHRLTFVWHDGSAQVERSRTALELVLRDAGAEPDVLLLESAAWHWKLPLEQRVALGQPHPRHA